jgi:site-specific DNA-methyltransferase (cytosine-N4-specific)
MNTNRGERGPYLHYKTANGRAWCGDSLDLLSDLPDNSINLICTSPPFALTREKAYGNEKQRDYVEWFVEFADHFKRVLTSDGSLVIDIGGSWIPGSPTRSIYHFELLVTLVRDLGFHLAEEFYLFNRAKLPTPAQWVTIERIRVKDAVNPIWWLSKTDRPIANNRHVLKPYSDAHRKLIEGAAYNSGVRPSGHVISNNFGQDNGGAIPPNLLEVANTSSNDPYNRYCNANGISKHPARFPREVPEFFIKFLTEPGHLVLDPFAGSNMTGALAEELGRKWLAYERDPDYLAGSVGRFEGARGLDDSPTTPRELSGRPARWWTIPQ